MNTPLSNNEGELLQACFDRQLGPIAVLHGGWSSERDVSISSGKAVYHGLKNAGLDVVLIDADRAIIDTLRQRGICHVFNVLHGPFGEDGVLQAQLQMAGISCTGSAVLASALAMDKVKSKQLWRGVGVSTADFVVHTATAGLKHSFESLGEEVFVKPANEGSSIGMSRAKSLNALRDAYSQASKFDSSVLLEQALHGREFTVSIVGDSVLPTFQLKPARDFYDYEAKYLVDTTEYLCPCGLNESEDQKLQAIALQAYRSLGCTGWGRVDVMENSDGEFFVLEVNTVPGMTDHSIVPMAARAANVSFSALVLNILVESLPVAGGHDES